MALARARITVEHTGRAIEVAFNPEEYSLNKDNNFASQAVPGLSSPILQFVHGNVRTLEMELFFDTTDARTDVREQTQKVTLSCTPRPCCGSPGARSRCAACSPEPTRSS
jgi:hypothetical protein